MVAVKKLTGIKDELVVRNLDGQLTVAEMIDDLRKRTIQGSAAVTAALGSKTGCSCPTYTEEGNCQHLTQFKEPKTMEFTINATLTVRAENHAEALMKLQKLTDEANKGKSRADISIESANVQAPKKR